MNTKFETKSNLKTEIKPEASTLEEGRPATWCQVQSLVAGGRAPESCQVTLRRGKKRHIIYGEGGMFCCLKGRSGQVDLTYRESGYLQQPYPFRVSSPPASPKPIPVTQQREDHQLPFPKGTWSLKKKPGEEQCLPHPARHHVPIEGTPSR